MNRKTNSISRRTILHGLGAAIALPYLEIMSGKTMAASSGKQEPARLACFYIPGCIGTNWFPKDTGFDYTMSPAHKPLAKYRDQFSVLTNLRHIQGEISGHVHPYNWLTGHNINLTPGAKTNTISMDQVAAQYIGQTYLPSLTLSWHDGVGTSTLSRNRLGVDIPATANYRTVFERLFPPADKAQLKEARERLVLNRSVLDTAMEEVSSLRRGLGQVDQQRLDQYLESVRDVEKRLDTRDEILKMGRPQFDEKSVRLETKSKSSFQEHLDLMMDLIAIAFQTDMTRVVSQVLGGEAGPNYDEYKKWTEMAGGKLRGTHDFHHKGGGAHDPNSADAKVINYRDLLLTSCLARLMDKLKDVQAAEGSLLDHTVLLMGGSQIRSHVGKSFPTLLAGGNKLGFKHGQHVKWKSGTKPMSDLYLTILQQIGCPVTSFKESTGAISELLT